MDGAWWGTSELCSDIFVRRSDSSRSCCSPELDTAALGLRGGTLEAHKSCPSLLKGWAAVVASDGPGGTTAANEQSPPSPQRPPASAKRRPSYAPWGASTAPETTDGSARGCVRECGRVRGVTFWPHSRVSRSPSRGLPRTPPCRHRAPARDLSQPCGQ